MERVQELIDKLWKQQQQGESPERLLATVQNLQDALTTMLRKEASPGGKVAVVLPPKRRITMVEVAAPAPQAQPPAAPPITPAAAQPAAADRSLFDDKQVQPPVAPLEINAATPAAIPEIPMPPMPGNPPEQVPQASQKEPYFLQKPPVAEAAPPAAPPAPPVSSPPTALQPEEREVYHLHFDTTDEAPTLTQQQYNPPSRELHEVIGATTESLNDRLKQDKPELAHKLKEAPIKDLRKAIGVNDKFLFVRELFRGDEAMYERSIKTINNFKILPEAEYWISRELKVKLGWNDSRDTVQAFYQLVKRRFS